jgi:hypothetical protein
MEDTAMSHPAADDPSPSLLFDEVDFTYDTEPLLADEDAGSTEPDTARKVGLSRIYELISILRLLHRRRIRSSRRG